MVKKMKVFACKMNVIEYKINTNTRLPYVLLGSEGLGLQLMCSGELLLCFVGRREMREMREGEGVTQ